MEYITLKERPELMEVAANHKIMADTNGLLPKVSAIFRNISALDF